jgi:broad specificity phosphatase PhoE
MRIYLLRHGESEANVAGVISDDPAHGYHLTPMGVGQAEVAAEALHDVPFTHVYVSEHLRTRETAEVMVAQWVKLQRKDGDRADEADGEALAVNVDRFPITVDARLNERRSGMDGRPVMEFNSLVKPDPVDIKPDGGESFREQMARVQAFLDAVAARHVDGTVLAVSHENPILAAQAVAGRSPEEAARDSLANCAWVELEWPPQEAASKAAAEVPGGHVDKSG